MSIEAQIETITPDKAALLLQGNTENRRVLSRVVDKYAAAMSRGEWVLNGEGIQIAHNGRLLNGQHRLLACIKAGANFPCLVVRGVDPAAFSTMDDVARRSMSDVLSIEGEAYQTALAGALRYLFLIEKTGSPIGGRIVPSHQELLSTLDANPGIRDDAKWIGTRKWCKSFLTPTASVFMRYWFRCDDDSAELFFEGLEYGSNLKVGNPVLLLRDRLIDDKSRRAERMKTQYKLALTFKAYRAFRDGRTLKSLRIRQSGDKAEQNLWEL